MAPIKTRERSPPWHLACNICLQLSSHVKLNDTYRVLLMSMLRFSKGRFADCKTAMTENSPQRGARYQHHQHHSKTGAVMTAPTRRGAKPKALSIAGCQLSAAVPTELSTVSCPFPAILSAPMLLGAITVPGTVLGSDQSGLILAVGSGKQTKLQQHLRLQQFLPGYMRHTRYQHQTTQN